MEQQSTPRPGELSWRLSSHPITLLCFLGFRVSSLLVYLFGIYIFSNSYVFIFIVTMLLLAADFYYLKNIAGRRLVGLRWWNEVDTATGDSHWVFESQDRSGGTDDMGNAKQSQNMTDKRFFWLSVYVQPALWIVLGILALVRFKNPIWLILIGELVFLAVSVLGGLLG
ncbi:hypothetical protein G7Y79_00017g043070 [Physcia stellaris]|nr:hypothetical protein G7Y79_00017g043070 [Physcia stellaris]